MAAWDRVFAAIKLEPLFGVKAWGANSTCDDVHHGPIPEGDRCCCMKCHDSGRRDDGSLKITDEDKEALKNWKPETKNGRDQYSGVEKDRVLAEPTQYAPDREMTRKERRARDREIARLVQESICDTAGYIPPMDPDRLRRLVDAGGGKVAL